MTVRPRVNLDVEDEDGDEDEDEGKDEDEDEKIGDVEEDSSWDLGPPILLNTNRSSDTGWNLGPPFLLTNASIQVQPVKKFTANMVLAFTRGTLQDEHVKVSYSSMFLRQLTSLGFRKNGSNIHREWSEMHPHAWATCPAHH